MLAGLMLIGIESAGGMEALRARLGMGVALLAVVPAYCIVTVTPLGEFVPWGVVNGMLFGLELGALINWTAWMGATLIQFGIGRQIAADFDLESKVKKLPQWLRRLPPDHLLVLVCGRWLPMGAPVVNGRAGAQGVTLRRLLACAAVGCVPQALLIAGFGAGFVWLW